jgi:hypothetical protein
MRIMIMITIVLVLVLGRKGNYQGKQRRQKGKSWDQHPESASMLEEK